MKVYECNQIYLYYFIPMTVTEWFMKAQIEQLEKENKKLKIEIWWLMWERDGLKMVVEKLHKEIEEQEAEWKWLFDEIDYRKRECKKLKRELDKYKNDIIYEEWLYD